MNRLTVLQVLPSLSGGGVERGTLDVASALVERGHRSLVISSGGGLVSPLTASGSEHHCWPIGAKSPKTFLLVRQLRKFLREQKVDILHARSRVPAWVAYLAWRGMPVETRPRFVTTVHGLYSVGWFSSVMMRSEKVIAVSNTVNNYIRKNYPWVQENRIQTILRGIEPQEFPRGFQASTEWKAEWFRQYPQLAEPGTSIITLAGRITRLKGHHDLIELMTRLQNDGIRAYALIVGAEDPNRKGYAAELKASISQRGLKNIIFTGQRSDIREIYSISSLVLGLSTHPESFGRTVVETLSLGRPVVAYDLGGVGETMRELFPEGLVPVGDLSALSETVKRQLSSPPEVPARDLYLRSRMLDETLDLYTRAAARTDLQNANNKPASRAA